MRTTWTFRFGLLAVVCVLMWTASGTWTAAIGESLVCDANVTKSDAIVVDNVDGQYLPFEQAMALRRAGLASRVLVPVWKDEHTRQPNAVALGITEVLASVAHLGPYELVPTLQREPISLNVARDVLAFVRSERIASVIVVSPLFRSRRSALVYSAILGPAGVHVSCAPLPRAVDGSEWTTTWHGVQEVAEQWLKLRYYRLYVLPFRSRNNAMALAPRS